MSSGQITDFAQKCLVAAGAYVVSKGYVDSSTWTSVSGAIMTLGGVLWGQFHHKAP